VSVLRKVTLRRPLTLLLSLLLAATLVVPAAAEPSSAELRSELQRAEERLQDIQMELAEAVEDYNEADVALRASEAELFVAQLEHDAVSEEVEVLSEAAELHVRRIHKLGPSLELSSILVAGNPTDAGAKAATLRRVMAGQRSDLEALAAAREAVAAAEARLAEQRQLAEDNAAAAADQRAAVESLIAARQDEIAELETQVQTAEAREEEERRRAEEERLRREAEERARQQAEEEARQQAAAEEARAARDAEERAAAQQREADAAAQREADAAAQREADAAASVATAAPSTPTPPAPAPSPSPSPSPSAAPPPPPPPPAAAPATRRSAQVAVDTALAQVGKPYQWGGSGPNSFDCSGLTSFAWRAAGVEITRTSRSQWAATKRVSRGDLQPGDLVFYSRSGPESIGHVAMYIGGGRVVEASRAGVPVRVSSTGLSRSDILGYGRP
jgi:peptidoglycan DL-endopeptidase CwlO